MSDPVERAFRRHYGQVYRYIRRRTADHERAEDIAQEVFAAATTALPDFSDEAQSPLACLYTVAKRRFADEARRRAHETAAEPSPVLLEYGPNIASSVRAANESATGRPAESTCTEAAARRLVRGDRVPARDKEPAAKMRFVRALRALRAELQKEGIEP